MISPKAVFCLQRGIGSAPRFIPIPPIPPPHSASHASLRSGPEPLDTELCRPTPISVDGPASPASLAELRLAPLRPRAAGHQSLPSDQPSLPSARPSPLSCCRTPSSAPTPRRRSPKGGPARPWSSTAPSRAGVRRRCDEHAHESRSPLLTLSGEVGG